ncbi:MAG: hypothetical protein O2976_02425, partial [Actinomycetota bacterium]|nr:hypothetical protein [Actinomycetota bacterium]
IIAMAPAALGATAADRQVAAKATAWLTQQDVAAMPAGQQADIITSRRLTGASPAALRPALAALARTAAAYATTPGTTAKVVIAQRAAGAAGALGGRNYLARLERSARSGRYGTTAFDQCLAMVALRVARRPIPPAAVTALTALRSGAGWSFALAATSPPGIDSTAMAIVALRAARVPASDPVIGDALAWLATQATDGGWTAYAGSAPSTDSTALVARAQVAAGKSASAGRTFIRGLAEPSGAIVNTRAVPESRLLATISAIPALTGISLAHGFRAG